MPRKKQYQWQADGTPEQQEGPSRSAKKRQCHALQALGEELTRLAPAHWQEMNLPPDMQDALRLFARIRDKEGRRRQLQYIGRLMRHTDAEELQARLHALRDAAATDTARFHLAEQWRERLLTAADDAVDDCLQQLFRVAPENEAGSPDMAIWQRLAQEARDEYRRQQLQAHAGKKTVPHARRALFRALTDLLTPATRQ